MSISEAPAYLQSTKVDRAKAERHVASSAIVLPESVGCGCGCIERINSTCVVVDEAYHREGGGDFSIGRFKDGAICLGLMTIKQS
jgi:hypothetical protein